MKKQYLVCLADWSIAPVSVRAKSTRSRCNGNHGDAMGFAGGIDRLATNH